MKANFEEPIFINWESETVWNILMELPLPDDGVVPGIRSDGQRITLYGEHGPLFSVDVATLRERPMDAVRAIYRGLRLDPTPHQIEAAWKSVEVGS